MDLPLALASVLHRDLKELDLRIEPGFGDARGGLLIRACSHETLPLRFTGALSLFLLSQTALSQSVETRLVKITESPSKSLATIEIHNLQGKGLKSFKAMLVLKDASGKVVDVQSRWLYGATPDEKAPAILANNKKTEIMVTLSTAKPFKLIDIIPSRIILEDGSIVTPTPTQAPLVPAEQ